MPLCACLSSSPNHSLGIWKSLCLAPIATSGSFTPQVTGPLEVSKLSLLFLLTSTYGNCFSWGKKKSMAFLYRKKSYFLWDVLFLETKQCFQNFNFHFSCKFQNVWLRFKCNENSFRNIGICCKTDIQLFKELRVQNEPRNA